MIIVGSHGEGPSAIFDRLLAGSVSRAVLRRQHRPVLVVPGDLPGSGRR
jgi:nucleotide-binding universal stress UspA family protein